MKTMELTLYLIHSVDGSFIIFHTLWQKFWACNNICVAIWKRNARQTVGHGAGMITYSSGIMKSHDKPQPTTLLSPDHNKERGQKKMPAWVITASISVNKERLAALDVSSGEETSITGTINFQKATQCHVISLIIYGRNIGWKVNHLRYRTYNQSPL